MNTTITIYYLNELSNWKDAIDLHLEATGEAEDWLKTVIQSDTVPNLAAKVEHHLNALLINRLKLEGLLADIESLELKLHKDNVPVNNELLTPAIKKEQNELRNNMYNVEKDFLDVKHACNIFLAETVNEQNKLRDDKN